MKIINFDSRWCGEHGIGRFANEIRKANVNFVDLPLSGNPAGKFDVLKLTYFLSKDCNYFYSPGYNAPYFFLKRCIITIHDLNHIDLSYNSSVLKKIYYEIVLKRACKYCAFIFTVSEFSKQRIVEWSGVKPEKIIVVSNGVSQEFSESCEPHSPGYKYIFVVGNRKQHKNEERSMLGFIQAKIDKDVKLVFSGEQSKALTDLAKIHSAESRIIFSGRLSNKKLAEYYKGAEFLLFPSLYEGFGLPVIESMACGTPVITSENTSLGEVAGDAAYLVDPYDEEDITKAIEKLYFDYELRATLSQKGLERVKIFSWEKTIAKAESFLNSLK
ncbi:glycosyltransferase family 4 protein [Klebsiella aerogenes]|uniref:glycosyltransferase family 4 protein n=1 Tax=Klebsiella aerogenes TaxID=548 RepID=UPI0013D232E5|nr:glycosyltransferase family 1 protein [Klebsiella aerogenes]MCU6319855.1 glycosyltransferase family 4 protein [Klebsiella aerogenes]NPE16679.1 glycosyltransferase family 4 protein [Klebsiella aerogenes]HBQ1688272.1 glycosyltransferase family 4 protein [Klebsiella aerogenes]HBV7099867.1 glycosyltransferase family 4 protein [Klebsiella aerogenes]